MLMLEPKLAILDETDSGLDVDAVRTVSEGVPPLSAKRRARLAAHHHPQHPHSRGADVWTAAHVMEHGVIVRERRRGAGG